MKSENYIRELSDGKLQIDKIESFCSLLEKKMPNEQTSFSGIMDKFSKVIKQRHSRITTGALSNSRGDWYEWLIAIGAWNYHVQNPGSHLALLLPNVRTFDVAQLYDCELYDLIVDLRNKVKNAAKVQLITSNPDFVLLKSNVTKTIENDGSLELITQINSRNIKLIEECYKQFVNRCNFEDIAGYFSVKSSLRPDRRLQMSHEGSLMKAIYTHLQTRKWLINPPGLKYYAISSYVSDSDRKALKTVATHSITTVFNVPQAAVDEVFEIDSYSDCNKVFNLVLK